MCLLSHMVHRTGLNFLPNPKGLQIIQPTNPFVLIYIVNFIILVNKMNFNQPPTYEVPLDPKD